MAQLRREDHHIPNIHVQRALVSGLRRRLMGQGHISTTRGIGGNIHVPRHKYGDGFALSLVCQGAILVPVLPPVIGCADIASPDNHSILKLLHFLQLPLYFLPEGVQGRQLHPLFIR